MTTHDNGAYDKSMAEVCKAVDAIIRETLRLERERVSEGIKTLDDWDDPNWDCIDFQAELLRIVNAR